MSVLQPNFKKLTEMVGSHLSQQVYYLITYTQVSKPLFIII